MAGMDMVIENAVKLLMARLPPETTDQLVNLARTGVGLKEQLDRIEQGQAETKTILLALIEAIKGLQPKGLAHGQYIEHASRHGQSDDGPFR